MVMAVIMLLKHSLQKITKLERETFEYSREKIENQSSTSNLSFDWNVFMEFIACPKSYVTYLSVSQIDKKYRKRGHRSGLN